MAVFCSDVSGAFDRVRAKRLLSKLWAKGIRGKFYQLIDSWLHGRSGSVCVEGMHSQLRALVNQVFQGTVWGPGLWNCFYEDARGGVNAEGFEETVFADDLNCFRDFSAGEENDEILQELLICQASLHSWGAANQVSFDPTKESFHILHRTDYFGEDFKILGCMYDCQLTMATACRLTAN